MEEVLVRAQALSRNGNIGDKPMSPDDHLSGLPAGRQGKYFRKKRKGIYNEKCH